MLRRSGRSYGNATQTIANEPDDWDDLDRLDRIEFYLDNRDDRVNFEAIRVVCHHLGSISIWSSRSSEHFLRRLGGSRQFGRSYGNQALTTESEFIMGKSQNEALSYWPSNEYSRTLPLYRITYSVKNRFHYRKNDGHSHDNISKYLLTTYLRLLHSGIYGWLCKPCEILNVTTVIRNTATDRNCSIVYMWWSWELSYTCLYLSHEIYLLKTVTEFKTSVIVVMKMITYKFFRGVLYRMHDRSHLVMVFFTW